MILFLGLNEIKEGKVKMFKRDKGFTLIEVIVVIAVIAILAAILAPQIAKHIKDAKISKARADVNTIAAAIGDFYKDTGRWPTSNDGTNGTSKTNDGLYVLFSNQGQHAATHGGGTDEWVTWSNAAGRGDTFRNQLVLNHIGGSATTQYPTKPGAPPGLSLTDVQGWNGPYLKTVPADPWGHKYYCNVLALYYGRGSYIYDQCWIISSGPNGTIETPVGSPLGNPQTGEINSVPISVADGGDDIGTMIK